MISPKFTQNHIEKVYARFTEDARENLIQAFKYAGETGVKMARENGRYIDHTGNLRSSIGYAIIENGVPIHQDFRQADRGTDKKTGVATAQRLMTEIASLYNKGLVLVLMAGMDYATYVESIDTKDVLTQGVNATEQSLKDILSKIVNYGR